MGMYASTVIVTGAGRGLRRALTAEPSSRGTVVHAGARVPERAAFGHELTGMREWVARAGGGAP
jgi:NAD(P)-dependent dehydrogenase (short-subunit alcohol dehydrogenase family)